jgi:hypothetical protein
LWRDRYSRLLVANALGDRMEIGIEFDDSNSDRFIPKGYQRLKKFI